MTATSAAESATATTTPGVGDHSTAEESATVESGGAWADARGAAAQKAHRSRTAIRMPQGYARRADRCQQALGGYPLHDAAVVGLVLRHDAVDVEPLGG